MSHPDGAQAPAEPSGCHSVRPTLTFALPRVMPSRDFPKPRGWEDYTDQQQGKVLGHLLVAESSERALRGFPHAGRSWAMPCWQVLQRASRTGLLQGSPLSASSGISLKQVVCNSGVFREAPQHCCLNCCSSVQATGW